GSGRAGLPAAVVWREREGDIMLLHFPIVILATLSPIPVADAIPKLDVEKECRFEGGSSDVYERCLRDENEAQKDVQAVWPQVSVADRNACVSEASGGGYQSYIELGTCLEMAPDVASREKGETVAERERKGRALHPPPHLGHDIFQRRPAKLLHRKPRLVAE